MDVLTKHRLSRDCWWMVTQAELTSVCGTRTEKNWAFFSDGSELYFYYAMGACAVLFRFDTRLEDGARFLSAACFKNLQLVPV